MRRASYLFRIVCVLSAIHAGSLYAQDWLAGFSEGIGEGAYGFGTNQTYCWAGLAVTNYDELAYYTPILTPAFSGYGQVRDVLPPQLYSDGEPGEVDWAQTLTLAQNQFYDCQITFAADITIPVEQDPGDGIVGDPYGFSLIDYFGMGGGPFLDSGFYGTDYPTYTTITFTTPLAAYDLPMYLGAPEIDSVGSNITPVAGQSSQPWTVDLYGQFLILYDTDVVSGQQTPYTSTVVLNDSNGQPVQTQPTITAPQTDTDITLSVPSSLPAGNYTIVVTTSIGWTVSTNFTVGDPTPSISSVTPGTWLAGQLTTVTVSGSGFGTSPTVQLSPADANVTFDPNGPAPCAGYSTTDQCFTINVTVQPADPGGAYNLTVTSQGYSGVGNGFLSGGPGDTPVASASVNIATIKLVGIDATVPTAVLLTYQISPPLTMDSASLNGLSGSTTIRSGAVTAQFDQTQLAGSSSSQFFVTATYKGAILISSSCYANRSTVTPTPQATVPTQYYDPEASDLNGMPAVDSISHSLYEQFDLITYSCLTPLPGSKTVHAFFASTSLDTSNNPADRDTTIGPWTELHSLQGVDGAGPQVSMSPWNGGETVPAQGPQFRSTQLTEDVWLNGTGAVSGTAAMSNLSISGSDGIWFSVTPLLSSVSVTMQGE